MARSSSTSYGVEGIRNTALAVVEAEGFPKPQDLCFLDAAIT